MTIEDREWFSEDAAAPRQRRLPGAFVVFALFALLVLGTASRHVGHGAQPAAAHDTIAPHDRWRSYLADERTCPGGGRTDLPLAEQAEVMVCLVDFARTQRALTPLVPVALLNGSSLAKAGRIVRCREFAHAACGRAADADARAAGYTTAFGENLYIAGGGSGAPRAALDGWLNSPGHRENLFRPEWRTEGIAVERLGAFGNYRDATLWVHQFGTG